MAVQDRLYTVQDIAHFPNHKDEILELHNGVVTAVPSPNLTHSALSAWFAHLLWAFIVDRKLGGYITGADCVVELNRYNTRIPDMAYLSPTILQCQNGNSFIKGGPDLVMEITLPPLTPDAMQQRVGEFLSAGTRLVWIVNRHTRTVDVYRKDGERTVVSGSGMLEGYEVLPGFKVSLETVFNPFQNT